MTVEAAGANCLNGGYRIDTGLDDDRDGVLQVAELDNTTYICDGADGSNGHNSLVSVSVEPVGVNCSNGGQKIDSGIDDDDDGVLQVAEIDATVYTCNGADGSNGLNTLVILTAEAAGANCTNGGQKVDTGIDDDADGTLQVAEVDNTTYICDGTDGANGTNGLNTLVVLIVEAAGANCVSGGHKLDSGIDDDADGTLQVAEIDSTTYICDGTDGIDGLNTLVNMAIEAAGANCANAGYKVDSGVDDDSDGVLQIAEIDETAYLCNGTDGSNGLNTLLDFSVEAAGANCANGGQKVDSGIDDDSDGVLQAGEIDQVSYVCNGTDGTAGAPGVNTLVDANTEAAGANCANGGQKIDTGLDDNADGVLQVGEIDSTSYVCNGVDGYISLVNLTVEAAGANCVAGGQMVESGLDDNTDGLLQPGEVDSTSYICDGLTSLVALTVEAAGANCADGGQMIDSGIDDNNNGVLDPGEIDSTEYVCNGDNGFNTLIAVTVEAAGANCAGGGQMIESGMDDSEDGVLDAGEVDSTEYVCHGTNGTNGTNGLNSLILLTAEAAGVNCANGGQMVESGLDDSADGTLDVPAEVDQTTYVCDGADGLQSLINQTVEPAGVNCATGGQMIESGLDDNNDGTLDAGEVDQTSYVCNA